MTTDQKFEPFDKLKAAKRALIIAIGKALHFDFLFNWIRRKLPATKPTLLRNEPGRILHHDTAFLETLEFDEDGKATLTGKMVDGTFVISQSKPNQ